MSAQNIVTDEVKKWKWLNTLRSFNPKSNIHLMTTIYYKRVDFWSISEWIKLEEWKKSRHADARVDYRTTHYNEIVIDYDVKNWEGAQLFIRIDGKDGEQILEKIGIPAVAIQKQKSSRGETQSTFCVVDKKDHKNIKEDLAAHNLPEGKVTTFDVGVRPLALRVENALKTLGIPHITCTSGGKGIHQHVFYTFDKGRYAELINKLDDLGVMPKDIRNYIFDTITSASGIPIELIGRGRSVDTSCNIWEDTCKGHAIRIIGGAHISKDGTFNGFKTMVNEVPQNRPVVKDFKDVVFPTKITPWVIPRAFIESFIAESSKKKTVSREQTITPVKYTGKMMNAPCVARIRNGMPHGRRSTSMWLLVLACRLDGLTEEQAFAVLGDYYERCDHTDFDFSEGTHWMHWSYSKDGAFWSINQCKLCREMDICLKDHCVYWKEVKRTQEEKEEREGRKRTYMDYNPKARAVHLRKYQRRAYAIRKGKVG